MVTSDDDAGRAGVPGVVVGERHQVDARHGEGLQGGGTGAAQEALGPPRVAGIGAGDRALQVHEERGLARQQRLQRPQAVRRAGEQEVLDAGVLVAGVLAVAEAVGLLAARAAERVVAAGGVGGDGQQVVRARRIAALASLDVAPDERGDREVPLAQLPR